MHGAVVHRGGSAARGGPAVLKQGGLAWDCRSLVLRGGEKTTPLEGSCARERPSSTSRPPLQQAKESSAPWGREEKNVNSRPFKQEVEEKRSKGGPSFSIEASARFGKEDAALTFEPPS